MLVTNKITYGSIVQGVKLKMVARPYFFSPLHANEKQDYRLD